MNSNNKNKFINNISKGRSKRVSILDTTLRDGSYVINFQFSLEDTSNILNGLLTSGIDWIEVGHGSGLASSRKGYGKSLETDEAYLEVCSGYKEANWGMFCIPGIADLEDIILAAKYNMKFIRIGVNPNDVEASFPFIELSKSLGMTVFVNFMKSYNIRPDRFAKYVLSTQKKGADIAYIVDSSGGMLPHEIVSYVKECKKITNIKLGFHGHNNLGLSISNSLTALESGVDIIDTSLQGMGRSSGNTPTEVFCLLLDKLGYEHNLEIFKLMDLGETIVRPFLKNRYGISSIDIVAGYAKFHSSYMNLILKYSEKYSLDPRNLIIEASKIDEVNVNDEILERVSRKLINCDNEFKYKFELNKYYGNEQS